MKREGAGGWLLRSVGYDGVLRSWDTRGGTAAAAKGLVGEWKGHRGGGEGWGQDPSATPSLVFVYVSVLIYCRQVSQDHGGL